MPMASSERTILSCLISCGMESSSPPILLAVYKLLPVAVK
jgi:hypothetical protein